MQKVKEVLFNVYQRRTIKGVTDWRPVRLPSPYPELSARKVWTSSGSAQAWIDDQVMRHKKSPKSFRVQPYPVFHDNDY